MDDKTAEQIYRFQRELKRCDQLQHRINRQEIFSLAQKNPVVNNALNTFIHGSLNWEDMLLQLVSQLVVQNAELFKICSELISRKPSSVIIQNSNPSEDQSPDPSHS